MELNMPLNLNLNLQIYFISKLELSPLTQRFEMQVSWPWRRTLCKIPKEDCGTAFSQHYSSNGVEWVLKTLPDGKNIGGTCTFDHSTPEQVPCGS